MCISFSPPLDYKLLEIRVCVFLVFISPGTWETFNLHVE